MQRDAHSAADADLSASKPSARLSPLRWLPEALAALDAAGVRRQLHSHPGPQAARIQLAGRQLVNLGSNDYLGLAGDSRLLAAATAALAASGCGAGASPLVTGHCREHELLERRLAEFEGTEAAVVFPTGFAANVGTIAALVGSEDAVYSDRKNHASLIDGCRLSRATVHLYEHCDAHDLARHLADGHRYRRRLIVTDSIFSMDGDIAPLVDLADLAEGFDAMLLVDEAHATGVLGASGRGATELLGVDHRVHVRVGTLSKALGSAGGFVAGSRLLIDWLVNRARPYIFSTALAPSLAATAVAALEIVEREPQRRQVLLARAAELRARLRADGWQLGNAVGQIIPLVVGEPEQTMQMSGRLRELGYWVPGIRPPSVPPGESLLRISLSFGHEPELIRGLLEALRSVRSCSVAL